jgi:hypothetical protein
LLRRNSNELLSKTFNDCNVYDGNDTNASFLKTLPKMKPSNFLFVVGEERINQLPIEERKKFKQCRKFFMLKHKDFYYKNTDSKDGKRPECIECTRELSKKTIFRHLIVK